MGRPVLFLDLDGVICCNFRGELEYDKLCQVKRVCDRRELSWCFQLIGVAGPTSGSAPITPSSPSGST